MSESSKTLPGATGRYRDEFYSRRRLSDVFPHQDRQGQWWFLEDGNHFRTLSDLRRFVDERKECGNV